MPRLDHIDLASAPVGVLVTVERVVDQDAGFLRFIEQRNLMPGRQVRAFRLELRRWDFRRYPTDPERGRLERVLVHQVPGAPPVS